MLMERERGRERGTIHDSKRARIIALREYEVVPPLNWINFEDEHDGHGNRTNVDRKYWNGLMKGNRFGDGGRGLTVR